MNRIPHTLIRASAGSGKTFQLAHRYIRLLSLGVRPDAILAVTFSRKAAGEIFQSIMEYLIQAAESESFAAETAARIEQPDLTREDFQRILTDYLSQLHRVRVGTLDGFFATLLRAFAFELGVSPYAQLIDTDGLEGKQLQLSVLNRLSLRAAQDKKALADLEEAYKQASFGQEDNRFSDRFLEYISDTIRLYRMLPDPAGWGTKSEIWGTAYSWSWDKDFRELLAKLEREIPSISDKKSAMGYLSRLVVAAKEYHRGQAWDDELQKVMEKFLPVLKTSSECELKLGRTVASLNAVQADWIRRIVRSLVCGEIEHAQNVTQGLWTLIHQYHQHYLKTIREQGRLSFDDELHILDPGANAEGRVFSSEMEGDRLFIDFRLDGRIDHWLLDEFQDTSTPQFRIIENLLDEVFQNTEANRSVFIVGDVKQSIYGWRGGEFGLMERLSERYRDVLDLVPMDATHRSCPDVLNLVNQMFSNPAIDREDLSEATDYWKARWGDHQSAGKAATQNGYAAVLEPVWADEKTIPKKDRHFEAICNMLNETKPWERGLSTVVLTNSNSQVEELMTTLHLQAPDIPVRVQGKIEARKEPVYNLLVSMVQWVLHPGDVAAEQQLRMSSVVADGSEPSQVAKTHRSWRAELTRNGLHRFLFRRGLELLAQGGTSSARRRWQDLLRAAEACEVDPDMTLDEFVLQAREASIPVSSQAAGVHLMTYHQSKGLGFDVVFLYLDAGAMDRYRGSFLSKHDMGILEPEWLLRKPSSGTIEVDSVLAKAKASVESTELYERLCLLYVGMTRAKRALYVLPVRSGVTANSLTPGNLVIETLAADSGPEPKALQTYKDCEISVLHETGDKDWYLKEPLQSSQTVKVLNDPETLHQRESRAPNLKRRNPSMQSDEKESAANLFQTTLETQFEFGTVFHAFMEFSQGLGVMPPDAPNVWEQRAEYPPGLCKAVLEEVESALSHEAYADVLVVSEGADLWLEAPFEILLGDDWVTGVFDRVVVHRDSEGKAVSAEILDYKTNQITEELTLDIHREHYAPQMDLYRKVLANMLNLTEGKIRCRLLFSKTGDVVEV